VPLVSVLQLYRTHVPDLPFPPGKDLLQLLWCPLDHEPNGGPRPELHWRGGNIEGALLADPVPAAGALENYLPWPCMLHPERVVEYPNWDLPTELVEALQERFDRLEEESGLSYFYHLSVAPGIKVGGYPGWTQEPDWPVCEGCGTRMDHLLTVESAEFDGESVSAWLPVEDRPTKGTIFDLPDEQRHAIQRAADVMIGDMGGVYIFICPRCPGQPYAYRSDSS
jgi:hypothetical protein